MLTEPLSRRMRWTLSFTAVILISFVSGTQYLFSAYGPALADRLKLSSTQTNIIASAGNYGLFLSAPFCGYVWKVIESRDDVFIILTYLRTLLNGYHVKLLGWQLWSSKVCKSFAPMVIINENIILNILFYWLRVCLAGSLLIFTSFLCLALTFEGLLPQSFLLCAIYLMLSGVASSAGKQECDSVSITDKKGWQTDRVISIISLQQLFFLR